jgi:hypothetical protein
LPFVASRPTRSTRPCPLPWRAVRCRLPAPRAMAWLPTRRALCRRLPPSSPPGSTSVFPRLESRTDSVSSRLSFSVARRCATYCERRCSIRQSLSLWPRDPAAFLPGALLHDRAPAPSSSPPSVSSGSLYSPPPTTRFHLALCSCRVEKKRGGGDQGRRPEKLLHADEAQDLSSA